MPLGSFVRGECANSPSGSRFAPAPANTVARMVPPATAGTPSALRRALGRVSVAAPRTAGRREDEPLTGRLLTVADHCWQCRSKVRAIVGVSVEPELTERPRRLPAVRRGRRPVGAQALDRRTLAAPPHRRAQAPREPGRARRLPRPTAASSATR